MKRVGNLFEKIIDLENIERAHKNARRGKRHYREVKMIEEDIEGYCLKIRQMLIDKTFTTAKYKTFEIIDSGKKRDICELPYYPDRIIHWALLQVIEEIFCKHFIETTYAAIPKKGTHKAKMKLAEYLKDTKGTQYCLKMDVKKFFPNIDKTILKQLLRKKFKCKDTLWLLDNIVDSFENGIPIGNYTSQYFGNYYLSFFDHWLKEQRRVKYYLRYMDDLVILHSDKEYLHELHKEIDAYLNDNLKLRIKDNWQVFPTFVRGVDFVGYRSFENFSLLRMRTKKKLKRTARRLTKKAKYGKEFTESDQCRVGSYKGVLSWCDSFRLANKTINKFIGGNYESKRNAKTATTWVRNNERHGIRTQEHCSG